MLSGGLCVWVKIDRIVQIFMGSSKMPVGDFWFGSLFSMLPHS